MVWWQSSILILQSYLGKLILSFWRRTGNTKYWLDCKLWLSTSVVLKCFCSPLLALSNNAGRFRAQVKNSRSWVQVLRVPLPNANLFQHELLDPGVCQGVWRHQWSFPIILGSVKKLKAAEEPLVPLGLALF